MTNTVLLAFLLSEFVSMRMYYEDSKLQLFPYNFCFGVANIYIEL